MARNNSPEARRDRGQLAFQRRQRQRVAVVDDARLLDDETYAALAASRKYVWAAVQLAAKRGDAPDVSAMAEADLAKIDAIIGVADRLTAALRLISPGTDDPKTAVLREALDRMMSLQADPENYKPEVRPVFRGGFSQAKHEFRDLLHDMIRELGREP